MKHYPSSIPFDVLRMLPLGKPDSSIVWYIVGSDGSNPVPCVRWNWLDDTGTRIGFFSLKDGKYISDF